MTEALRELIAAVEAESTGLAIDGYAAEVFPPESAGGACTFHLVLKAYRGSLDAAKALHEAVLPGWRGIFTLTSPLSFASVFEVNENQSHAVGEHRTIDAKAEDPARAWLLAILYALRALSEAEG